MMSAGELRWSGRCCGDVIDYREWFCGDGDVGDVLE